MNLLTTFNDLFNPKVQGIAHITADLEQDRWQAVTQTAMPLILTGSAAVGQVVFYDMRTRRILGQAPDVVVTDIAV